MWRWIGSCMMTKKCTDLQPSLFSYSILSFCSSLSFGDDSDDSLISNFCYAFRSCWSWDMVSKRFRSVDLTDSMVDRVLLQLKEPSDAKNALGFFHWCSKCTQIQHTIRSYSIVVHILVNARMLIDARVLLRSILNSTEKLSTRICFIDSFIDTYAIVSPRPIAFDFLIQTYSKLRMIDAAVEVSIRLQHRGFCLSLITYNTMIHFAEKSGNFNIVWEIYEHMITNRAYPNEFTTKTMINALCMQGELQKCIDVVDRIHGKRCSPMVIVNTSFISRILNSGRIEKGLVLLRRLLQKNMILDTISFSFTVYAKVKVGDLNMALKVHQDIIGRGFHPNSFIYTSIISGYCSNGRVEEALCMIENMEKMGVIPYDETFNHIISGCSIAGMVDKSLMFCENMIKMRLIPNVIAVNDMISKLCELGSVKKANTIITLLLDNGFCPDECTYSHLINGFGKIGEARQVINIFYEMEYKSIPITSPTYISIINILRRCKKFEEAEKFSRIMKDRQISGVNGIYKAPISSFSQMRRINMDYDI